MKNVKRVYLNVKCLILQAIEFCEGQVGKKYNLNIFRLNTSYYSESWYCSELNYAAVIIASDGYAYVSVKENWFATDVAFSIVQNGTRFISYANQLTNQNNCIKMNIRYSKK